MEETNWLSSLGQPGGIVAIVIVGVGALIKLNSYLRKDSVDKAGDLAQIDLLNMLRGQVDAERARADNERARADKFLAALDTQTAQLSALKDQVTTLSIQVSSLQVKLSQYEPAKTPS